MREATAEQEQVEAFAAADTVRRCALSRAHRPRDDLIRFVLGPDGIVVPDLKEKLPGRGVWLTGANDIVAEAVKRNAFARALKTQAKASPDLADLVDRLLSEAALGAFALANKAGEVVFGHAKVAEALAKAPVLALVHARRRPRTAAASSTEKPAPQGPDAPIAAIRCLGTDELGLASGRANVIHAALIQGGAARRFLAAAQRLERYRKGSAAFAPELKDTDTE